MFMIIGDGALEVIVLAQVNFGGLGVTEKYLDQTKIEQKYDQPRSMFLEKTYLMNLTDNLNVSQMFTNHSANLITVEI